MTGPNLRLDGRVAVVLGATSGIGRALSLGLTGGPTLDFAERDWHDILETNLTGTLRGCQVFGRHMLERGYGRIIHIASLTSSRGPEEPALDGQALYLF
ncbi:MAG: SDR family NAD(P)-dependent oxidoreductase [Myxococcales bacterium]|nr:SDR family NAD(P)-dependent oxidoreductase [Myxococcales bacterium]